MRSKYKLSFFNENTLEEVWTFRLSRLGAIHVFHCTCCHHIMAATYLIVGTPLKNFLPGYLKRDARAKIMDNALRIDSLSKELEIKDHYLQNLNRILTGNIQHDSIEQIKDSLLTFPKDSFLNRSETTAEFIEKYEKDEKYRLNVFHDNIPTDGFIFYPPPKGMSSTILPQTRTLQDIDIRT